MIYKGKKNESENQWAFPSIVGLRYNILQCMTLFYKVLWREGKWVSHKWCFGLEISLDMVHPIST